MIFVKNFFWLSRFLSLFSQHFFRSSQIFWGIDIEEGNEVRVCWSEPCFRDIFDPDFWKEIHYLRVFAFELALNRFDATLWINGAQGLITFSCERHDYILLWFKFLQKGPDQFRFQERRVTGCNEGMGRRGVKQPRMDACQRASYWKEICNDRQVPWEILKGIVRDQQDLIKKPPKGIVKAIHDGLAPYGKKGLILASHPCIQPAWQDDPWTRIFHDIKKAPDSSIPTNLIV